MTRAASASSSTPSSARPAANRLTAAEAGQALVDRPLQLGGDVRLGRHRPRERWVPDGGQQLRHGGPRGRSRPPGPAPRRP